MEDIETVEDAREAAKNRGMEDWKDVSKDEADFSGFQCTAEYANITLPYLEGLADCVEDSDSYLHDEIVDIYWKQAAEVVHD